ncbi:MULTISPECIES: cyclodeaminase/cyclohydrolase family protein [unclassified Sedimentibacter]|uniref:cyclodeaminase/cyclohydrolase family protein n=1 Tax=unclassified Sedimentibacter TaxID=2649220 RepID=UPI0027E0C015|nr:cyclodeaminase/cyclohydrolase family protein [Sedimentibacter sp. MB35-C1]WMJ77374.1 cyclodeaminase/cyclohydrolase family protein [Sedimentibacter sp. MB35-C1]
MNLTKLSCEEFASELASKKPVPGGGGAAALAGALGVALNSMVANFSKGKKKFIGFEKQHEEILEKGEKLAQKLLTAIEKDAENFEPLSKAYVMPSGTEEEKRIKNEVMQKCLKDANEAPLETLRLVYEGILLHDELVDISSKTIISDIGVGVQLLKAALNSAYLNVLININSISDQEYVNKNKEMVKGLLKDGNVKADKIYEKVLKILS